MALVSTYTCDNCGTEKLTRQQIAAVTVESTSIGGAQTKHLCLATCEDEFMDGSISGNDLFLVD